MKLIQSSEVRPAQQQLRLNLDQPSSLHAAEHGAHAVVRCKGFRCAAYLDEKGFWRSPANGEKLEVLEVLVRF